MSIDSTLTDEHPIDPDDELLVAYLDGELVGGERSELEDRLLNDERLRIRLQDLQSGWDMLDDLPVPSCDEKLVESTLELVVADVTRLIPTVQDEKSPRRFVFPATVALLAVLMPAIGYFAVEQQRQSELQQQLRDLEIAENIDAYIWGDDLELMRELVWNESFNSMVQAADSFGAFRSEPSTTIRDTSLSDRQDAIKNLPVDTRATIESRWNYYRSMDEATKKQVYETAKAVESQKESELLLKTMSAYAAWRQKLPNSLRDAIDNSTGDARRKAIQDGIDHTMSEISRESGKNIDDDTADRILFVLKTVLESRVQQDSAFRASYEKQQAIRADWAERKNLFHLVTGHRPGPGDQRDEVYPTRIQFKELETIVGILSDKALEDLDLATFWTPYRGRNPQLLEMTLREWAEEAIRRQAYPTREETSAIQRYNEIPDESRDRIDLMEPSRFKEYLSPKRRSWRGGPPRRP